MRKARLMTLDNMLNVPVVKGGWFIVAQVGNGNKCVSIVIPTQIKGDKMHGENFRKYVCE
jgi:hypothetical protein